MPIHDWTRVPDAIFHSFHGGWITALVDVSNEELLPDGYYAGGEKQIPGMEPDVMTFVRAPGGGVPVRAPAPAPGGGPATVSLLERPPAVSQVLRMEPRDDGHEYGQDTAVVRRSGDDHMVAVIEIVSAGHKSSRGRFDTFLLKVLGLIGAGVHVLLVDLHPPGPRDPRGLHAAVWSRLTGQDGSVGGNGAVRGNGAAAATLTQASYLADFPPRAFAEPTRVGGELVRMPLFLTTEDYIEAPLPETYAERIAGLAKPWRNDLTG